MQIEVHPPPAILRRSCTEFLSRIREEAAGWVSVPLAEVIGDSIKTKQSVILGAATNFGLEVQTEVKEGRIYELSRGMCAGEVR